MLERGVDCKENLVVRSVCFSAKVQAALKLALVPALRDISGQRAVAILGISRVKSSIYPQESNIVLDLFIDFFLVSDARFRIIINVIHVGAHDGAVSELLFPLKLISLPVLYFFPFLNSRNLSKAEIQVSRLELASDERR